jgi:serine protease
MARLTQRHARIACAIGFALGMALPAAAETVSTIRVMLHPSVATRGTLPPDALARLETLAGTSLALTSTTRTGALDLALGAPLDDAGAAALVKQLRVDRSVLWVEPRWPAPVTAKANIDDPSAHLPGRRLLVRLKDDTTVDWAALLSRLSARAGVALKAERQIAGVWVLSTAFDQTTQTLARMAELIQEDPGVQYADAVRRLYPQAAPNDPYFGQQWALSDRVTGINIEHAWALQPDASSVTVAVVDTGILPHPDLEGRVLPGYDFISDPDRARDGNARDADPRDEGDWSSDGECGYAPNSSFHGLFVAGQIAANANNGIGIAGIAAGVKILPVRVLGKCGGTSEDIFEGMLWASGMPIPGLPPNPNPAKIINMSLGGFSACAQSMQEAVDDAIAQGSIVVVAAGNESLEAADFSPANCSGVITVGAQNRAGNLTSYSNFGRRIDLMAPGGDLPATDLIVSLSNDGTTTPQKAGYKFSAGTSFSAPLVSGTAALMLARNPLTTAGRVLDVLTGTSRSFPLGSQCTANNVCGAGMLDSGAAIASIFPNGAAPVNAVRVVEFYRADLDHYFISASPAEINYVDTFLRGIFQRTGLFFYAYPGTFLAPPGVMPVCRFYADASVQINSHYYSADPQDCAYVQAHWYGTWNYEQSDAFYVQVPDFDGNCPANTLPVYRFFNNRRDANHRYTVDLSVRRAMVNRSWIPEGHGPNSVVFCSAI